MRRIIALFTPCLFVWSGVGQATVDCHGMLGDTTRFGLCVEQKAVLQGVDLDTRQCLLDTTDSIHLGSCFLKPQHAKQRQPVSAMRRDSGNCQVENCGGKFYGH